VTRIDGSEKKKSDGGNAHMLGDRQLDKWRRNHAEQWQTNCAVIRAA